MISTESVSSGQLSRDVIQTKAETIGSKLYSYPPPSLSVVIAGCVGDTGKVDVLQPHILHPGEVSMLAEAGSCSHHQQGGRSSNMK